MLFTFNGLVNYITFSHNVLSSKLQLKTNDIVAYFDFAAEKGGGSIPK